MKPNRRKHIPARKHSDELNRFNLKTKTEKKGLAEPNRFNTILNERRKKTKAFYETEPMQSLPNKIGR
jgi:hypothetical protein